MPNANSIAGTLTSGFALIVASAMSALAVVTPADAQMRTRGVRVIVSTAERRLYLVESGDTTLNVPAAVGRAESVELNGRRYTFKTPRGTRRVLARERNPIWTPPDWHYYEKAEARNLQVVMMARGRRYQLNDGTYLEIRGKDVGRVNQFGNFWPWTPGVEISFDGKLFVPPIGTNQRRVPNALGAFKLDLGDGYLIHGTHLYNKDSVGQAVSHGCVRLEPDDLESLYDRVPVGTIVEIQ